MKEKYLTPIFLIILLLLFTAHFALSANRYWVGSGNWTSSNTANWAASSGGSTGQTVPSTTDNVFFDANSSNCIVQVNADINDLTLTGGSISFGGSGTFAFRIRGNYSKTSGTTNFDAGAAMSFDVDGNFTHNYYTFIAPAGRNMFIGGNWTRSGGSFSHNNGTVLFDGNNATFNYNTEAFFNLNLSKNTGQTLTLTTGQTIYTYGTLTLTDGLASGGILAPYGNVTVSSTWDGGNCKLTFVGNTTTQTFTLTGAEALFQGNIEIQKGTGTVSLASNLTLNAAGQTLTLSGASLTLNSKTLTLYNASNTGTTFGNGEFVIVGPGTFTTYNYHQAVSGTITLSGALVFNTLNYFKKETSNYAHFNAASAVVDIDGDFTNSTGTFTAPTGNMYVGGNFTRTGGTFSHNNGTIVLDGNNATINAANESFYHLTLLKTNGQLTTITSGQTIYTYGILTLSDGLASGGILAPYGNVTISPTWDGGNSKLAFVGNTTTQTFTLTGAEALFQGNIEIQKGTGTVSLASNLTLNTAGQTLTLSGASLTLNSKTLTLYNASNTGTTFGNGEFVIVGPGTFTTYNYHQAVSGTITLSGALVFNTLNYFKKETSNYAHFNAASAVVDIDGDFTNSTGTFTAPTGNMYVGGNFTRTGGTFSHNNGTLIFDGNNSTFTSNNTTLYNITMNKNSGKTMTIATGSAINTNTKLTLNSGNIITSVWTQLMLGCNINIVMGNSPNNCSSASYIDGPLTRALCSTGSLFYPIGRNGNYRPLSLYTVPNGGSTNFTAEQIENNIPNWCLPNDLCSVSKIRHFRVVINGGQVYNDPITLSYCADDGVTNASDLRIAQQVGTCWKNIGGTGTAVGSGTITSTVDFNTYGDFILGTDDCINPLPVKLLSFTSKLLDLSIKLHWETATEIDNDRFEVERSFDGRQWIRIGTVKGSGNTNSTMNYTFEDNNLPSTPKIIYYRLKQVDYNGDFEFSPIVVEAFKGVSSPKDVKVTLKNNFILYPNPATEKVTIESVQPNSIENHFEISDLNGKIWFKDLFTDFKTIDVNHLASGLYFVTIYNLIGEVDTRVKIILNH